MYKKCLNIKQVQAYHKKQIYTYIERTCIYMIQASIALNLCKTFHPQDKKNIIDMRLYNNVTKWKGLVLFCIDNLDFYCLVFIMRCGNESIFRKVLSECYLKKENIVTFYCYRHKYQKMKTYRALNLCKLFLSLGTKRI